LLLPTFIFDRHFATMTTMTKRTRLFRQLFSLLTFVFLLFVVWSLFGLNRGTPATNVPISQIAKEVKEGRVEKLIVKGNQITAVEKDKTRLVGFKESSEGLKDYGITSEQVIIDVKNPDSGAIWTTVLSVLLPFLLLGGFLYFITRQARTGGASYPSADFGLYHKLAIFRV
jgi:ATP-dependent Zn protease